MRDNYEFATDVVASNESPDITISYGIVCSKMITAQA